MRFGYQEFVAEPGEWKLDPFELQQINLIVGRNSTGKSRVLNVISALGRTIATGVVPPVGRFVATFAAPDGIWQYLLGVANEEVKFEELIRGKKEMINRAKGMVWSEETQSNTLFKLRGNQIAINAKLDLIQSPYLQQFNDWANSIFHFHFGTPFGQPNFMVAMPNEVPAEALKDENQVSLIYAHGYRLFGNAFNQAIVDDMKEIGYDINDVQLAAVTGLSGRGALPLIGLSVSEQGVPQRVEQQAMSTGMFRALAIFIHVNLCIFTGHANLILLDDIGEGLDFARASKLIERVVAKIRESTVQLIMTSNDRFIMNAVDVDYWTVLDRVGSSVRAINKSSHPHIFEEFKFTGLQNFDFFSMGLATETARAHD